MDVFVPLEWNSVGQPSPNRPRRFREQVAVIDAEDAERVLARHWKLHVHRRSGIEYAQEVGLKGIMLHRFIMNLPRTPGPDDKVDHIDGDGLNCRRSNLRVVTNIQNIVNSAPRGGSSRYKGVRWDSGRKVWTATISSSYATEEEAARAYNALAAVLWGEHAWLNKVQPQEPTDAELAAAGLEAVAEFERQFGPISEEVIADVQRRWPE
jgi:hypothetical protein